RKSPIASEVSSHLRGLGQLAETVAREMAGQMAEVAEVGLEALDGGGKRLLCGYGGRATASSDRAEEDGGGRRRDGARLPAIALTTDTSLLTAAGNDVGFERIFERQVLALGSPGDVLFLHSTSGESENLLAAARAARAVGVRTVALLARGGGRLKDLVDV